MSCEMHDGVGTRQHLGQSLRVQNIALHQFKSLGQRFVTSAEVVENRDLVAGISQGTCGMTANVHRTANYQNVHCPILSDESDPLIPRMEGSITLYTEA